MFCQMSQHCNLYYTHNISHIGVLLLRLHQPQNVASNDGSETDTCLSLISQSLSLPRSPFFTAFHSKGNCSIKYSLHPNKSQSSSGNVTLKVKYDKTESSVKNTLDSIEILQDCTNKLLIGVSKRGVFNKSIE